MNATWMHQKLGDVFKGLFGMFQFDENVFHVFFAFSNLTRILFKMCRDCQVGKMCFTCFLWVDFSICPSSTFFKKACII